MASIETGLRQAEVLNSKMNDLRERLEKHINLKQYTDNHKNDIHGITCIRDIGWVGKHFDVPFQYQRLYPCQH